MLELANRGNLEEYVKQNNLSIQEIKSIFLRIAEGLKFIHDSNIIHRDIKPNNVLITQDEVKIADFGVSKLLSPDQLAHTAIGTNGYMSPQACIGEAYTVRNDIFSLGVTLYFMFYKATPWLFANNASTNNFIVYEKLLLKKEKMNEIFEYKPEVFITESAKDLIKNMIMYSENDRYDINDVLKHSFLKNYIYESITLPKITFFCGAKNLKIEATDTKLNELIKKEKINFKTKEITEKIYEEIGFIRFLINLGNDALSLLKGSHPSLITKIHNLTVILIKFCCLKSGSWVSYLKSKKKSLFFLTEEWDHFYNNKEIFEKCLNLMKELHSKNNDYLKNLEKLLKKKKVSKEYIKLLEDKEVDLIGFFRLLEKCIIEFFNFFNQNLEEQSDEIFMFLYDLLILLTHTKYDKCKSKKNFINFEKYLEDKHHRYTQVEIRGRLMKIKF